VLKNGKVFNFTIFFAWLKNLQPILPGLNRILIFFKNILFRKVIFILFLDVTKIVKKTTGPI